MFPSLVVYLKSFYQQHVGKYCIFFCPVLLIVSQTQRWKQLFQTDTTVVEICALIVPQHDEGGLYFLRGTRSFVVNEGNMSFFVIWLNSCLKMRQKVSFISVVWLKMSQTSAGGVVKKALLVITSVKIIHPSQAEL